MCPALDWLLSLTENDFREIFRASAVRRTKWRGLIRNACVAAGNSAATSGAGAELLRERLRHIAASTDALLAEHAQWALAQFPPLALRGRLRMSPGKRPTRCIAFLAEIN